VLIEPIVVDGRRVLLVRPVVRRRGDVRAAYPIARAVRPAHTPRRRLRPGVVVALVAAVLGLLVALGWAVWFVLSLLFAHAVEVGVVLALVVLLTGAGGGCTVVVTHIRR
jgi:hypothetical protein